MSFGAMMLYNQLFPPPKPAQPAAPAAGAPAVGKDQGKANAPAADANAKGDAKAEADEKPKDAAAPLAAGAGAVPAMAAADPKVKPVFVTLGSIDMASDYRMLVTLTNTGAALYRTEFASSRFRDQHDWSGYLGELELKNVPGGVQVQVVGAGTPAASAQPAAIEVGDVIVGIGSPKSSEIANVDEFDHALAATQPGQEITLQVRHGDNGPQARTMRLIRKPFAVLRPESENYLMRGVKLPADFVDQPSFVTTIASLDNVSLPKEDFKRLAALLERGNWELGEYDNQGQWVPDKHDEKSAAFRRVLPELKLEIIKRYSLAKAPAEERDNPTYPAYNLDLEIELRNTGDAPRSVAYRLDGPTGMPLEGWWFARKISRHWGGGGLRDVAVRFFGSSEQSFDDSMIAKGKVPPMGDGQALAYAGVDGQYFSAVLIPGVKTPDENWFETTEAIMVGPKPDVHDLAFTNVTSRMTRNSVELPAGGSLKDGYKIFLGPKRPDLLANYYPAEDPNYSLKGLLYYGWPIFAFVAQLMLAVLHFFYGIVGNYGIAIIMLTVLVRGAMFPISFKQTQNMARIQALKPEMDRINEKYKNDMQKKSQATQELYKKNKINPLGGCLPVFLQLPVFIGLYRALLVDVELRQSPLFGHGIRWVSNLAAPDMLWNWSSIMPEFVTSGQGFFGLGPYLNVLPLVTVSLFLVTQKMSMPEPTNEQAVMQQKMMKYMTLLMGLFFYKVASGLCLYFIASSLWGIAERKLLPKPKPIDPFESATTSRSAKSGSNGNIGSKKSAANRKK